MTKKILLINDQPGYGKVAIPAMTPALIRKRFEVFSLPTMIVSNTFNYGRFATIDTTEYMKDAVNIWRELGFTFDAISTGFIPNDAQAEFLAEYCRQQAEAGAVILVDPIMADNGKLYNSVTEKRVEIMKKMVAVADYLIPNITEACLLSGTGYSEDGYTEEGLSGIAKSLHEMGAKSVAITSALLKNSDGAGSGCCRAVVGYDGTAGECFTVRYEEIPLKINGSGDTFASIVLSEIVDGTDFCSAVRKAVAVVRELIAENLDIAGEYNGLPIEAFVEKM